VHDTGDGASPSAGARRMRGAAMMGNRGKEAKEEDKAWGKKLKESDM